MTEILEERIGGMRLLQAAGEFKLTQDALLLTAFAPVHSGDRVCDLGCGVGNLLVPLAARAKGLTLDGVELRETAAALCRENLARNGLAGTIVTGDLNRRYEELPWGRYDLVLANPPYFPVGSGFVSPDPARELARTEGEYTLEAACGAAERLCKYGGRFALCLRPERLAELMTALQAHHLEPKRLQLIQPSEESPANLALLEARKGGRPGLQVLPVKFVR